MAARTTGYQQLTGLSAVKTLTIPANTTHAVLQAEAQALRYRADGVAPTASVGMLIPVNTSVLLTGADLADVQVIEVTPSGILNVTYYET